jgi:hypothetical protein
MSESKLPTSSHREDIRLAASKMTGVARRSFQAEMAEKYCNGSARLAENVFGWNRKSVQTGLGEKRTGIICVGAQPTFGGNISWEKPHPEIAEALRNLAEEHAQQDPTFRTTMSYSRLTAEEALKQLRAQGFSREQLPCKSSMAEILNRMGYRKYNPIEHCWGILELHWNGAKLTDVETMLEWAKTMTWKGIHPLISSTQKIYEKGIKLTKKAMKKIEAKLERNPLLPKWDILIQPT